MNLDLQLVLKAGIIWGIVAVVLIVVLSLVPFFDQFGVDGLSIATYATVFAGVHFSARNPHDRNIIVGLIGGMLAGIIAAIILVIAALVLPMVGIGGGGVSLQSAIVPALIAGIAGAVGMEVVKRI